MTDQQVRRAPARPMPFLDASGPAEGHTSPLDGRSLGELPTSSGLDVARAYVTAREAQQSWAAVPVAERSAILLRYHDGLLDAREELMDSIQLESGKTRVQAYEEVAHVALTARYYARRLPRLLSPHRRLGVYPVLTQVEERHVPKGVLGLITPWNFPLSMAVADGLAAVAAGNGVVHKPDQQSMLTAIRALELLADAGLPVGLWRLVHGDGPVVGGAVVAEGDHICFTGSTATGTTIAAGAAERLVAASLELGGKNPMVVLPGAPVDKVARGAMRAVFASAGQLCVSMERIYLPAADFDRYADAIAARTRALRLGVGLDYSADIGTLASAAQLAKVREHVDDAVAHGATVLAGGHARPDVAPYAFEPTVLTGVTAAMRCFAEETFGPLVSLYPYDSVDEAVDLANAGSYGLNASVWGPTPAAGRAVARRLVAGSVNVDEGYAATFGSVDAPMGGMRRSGLGRRQGAEGLLRFTEAQTVATQRLLPLAPTKVLPPRRYVAASTALLRALRRTGRP